ncbi:MAG: cofactor-independent phosphoglycerate mutase, partial [Odoribacter sp.]|nr:cofactor-independent phosphoglycerate mutase [Odoribacter sp.]
GNKTPLMAAKKPNIDALAKKGRCGRLTTVPGDMHPGSEVANLGLLGYDVHEVFEGRAVLEAASMGVKLEDTDLALRCNFICIENGKIKNHSAGHITSEESFELIETLENELGSDRVKFYPGVSYRHLVVIKNGKNDISCTPPHDVPGIPFKEVLVKPDGENSETADLLNSLILKSQKILENHPINKSRTESGRDPANSIWLWSPGYKPKMKTFRELYGIRKGAVISAVDLIQGIGVYAGFDVIKVEGATGLYDTNYEGKAKAAVDALKEVDFVYLHIEASDEAGHEGDAVLKTRTIEYLDRRVVKYIIEETGKMKENVTIGLLPDHPTLCATRTHTRDAVPFIIWKPGESGDPVQQYDEESVKKGFYGELKGNEFIKAFLGIRS